MNDAPTKYRAFGSFVLAVATVCVGACGDDAPSPSASSAPAPVLTDAQAGGCRVAPTFASIHANLLASPTCAVSGCHRTPGQGGLSLDGARSAVHARLVGAPSGGSALARVVAGAPEESFLFLKIASATPPSGTRMPPKSGSELPDCEVAAVRAWIAAGAKDDQ